MFAKIAVVLLFAFLGWAFKATLPPPPLLCSSPNGPPVTYPRIKLSDGRHLAYLETGVPKEEAKFKIVAVHGLRSSKEFYLPVSKELVEELGLYILSYDRAGYGYSDPNPMKTVKSEAFDIQELADQIDLGPKFYLLGVSMGGYPLWGCLKYIPHRIAGMSLLVPVVNYWWPSFPSNLSRAVYKSIPVQDQWGFRVVHYVPRLLYWWCTQKWFPTLSSVAQSPLRFSRKDKEILKTIMATAHPNEENTMRQGVFESVQRDLIVGFGKWEFDPMELKNPFPNNESCVYIWQGYEDKIIPFRLQRYVSQILPWIAYHEVSDGGHLFVSETYYVDIILKQLLLGIKPPST